MHGFCTSQEGNKSRCIMTVNRPQVGKPHILKNSTGNQHLPQPIFKVTGEPKDSFSSGDMGHKAAIPLLHTQILFLCPKFRQVSGQTAHVPVNGQGIVVENHHHRFSALCRIVEGLISHTACCSTIAHNYDYLIRIPQQGTGSGHAQSDRNRAGSVSGHECVGIAFLRLGETGNPFELPQMVKIRLASGQHLMDIRLMTYVKHQTVKSCIVDSFNGNCQLNHTQIGCNMAPGFG